VPANINQIFKPSSISMPTRIGICCTIFRHTVFYGSESCMVRLEERLLILAEIYFKSTAARYTHSNRKII
jgi:hypothetical protein